MYVTDLPGFCSWSLSQDLQVHSVCTQCVLISFYMSFFQDWSIKFDQDSPVAPRFDVNAPDLYIPGRLDQVNNYWTGMTPSQYLVT